LTNKHSQERRHQEVSWSETQARLEEQFAKQKQVSFDAVIGLTELGIRGLYQRSKGQVRDGKCKLCTRKGAQRKIGGADKINAE
jgi:hypothetical protein